MNRYFNWMRRCHCLMFVALIFTVSFTGAGRCEDLNTTKIPGVEHIEGATVELVKKQTPIPSVGPYSTLIVATFEASDELKKNYKDVINQFQVALVSDLRTQNVFPKVLDDCESHKAATAKVTGKILDMRITSGSARLWGGALAGVSYMITYVKVIDTESGKVINEKTIETHNNPMAAAWSFGSSDISLPMDMGKIVSAYLCRVIPSK